jgi:hypothetical protein
MGENKSNQRYEKGLVPHLWFALIVGFVLAALFAPQIFG